jgi:hypothetical protein
MPEDHICGTHGPIKVVDGKRSCGCTAPGSSRPARYEEMPLKPEANHQADRGPPGTAGRLDSNTGEPVVKKDHVDVYRELEEAQRRDAEVSASLPRAVASPDYLTPALMSKFSEILYGLPLGGIKATAIYLHMSARNVKRVADGVTYSLRFKHVKRRVLEFIDDVLKGNLILVETHPGTDPREVWKKGLPSHVWIRTYLGAQRGTTLGGVV